MKERKAVPKELQRKLLVQCGYKCSVPRCDVSESLEFHHINGVPTDNRIDNLIVFCAVHHHQADVKKIEPKACTLIKQLLPRLDGLNLANYSPLSLSEEEFSSFLDIGRIISKESLRIITEQFISFLLGKNEGYRCATGIPEHDFLVSKKLIYKAKKMKGPNLWKISEKGILFCKFLFTSQYFLPFVAFEEDTPKRLIIKWNFEEMPF